MNKSLKKYLFIILGVVGGYAVSLVLSPSTTAIIHKIWPATASENPSDLYLYIDLLYSSFYLMIGAFVAAWIANNLASSIALGVIYSILGLVTIVMGMDTIHPLWYQWFFVLVSIPFASVGGYFKIRSQKVVSEQI